MSASGAVPGQVVQGDGTDVLATDPEKVVLAAQSMADSLRRTVAGGLVGLPLVLLAAAASDLAVDFWVLVVVHVLALPLAVWGLSNRTAAMAAVVVAVGVIFVDLKAATDLNDPLGLLIIWVMNMLVLGASLMGRGWQVVAGSAATAVALSIGVIVFHADWGDVRVTTPTTLLVMVVAIGLLMRFLYQHADQADDEVAIAARERDRLIVARSASREAADAARTMHDTVINTLAALASGGVATRDIALVKERCRRDVATLEPLLDGRRPEQFEATLTTLGRASTVNIVREGLTDDELRAIETGVPAAVLRAFHGATDEAVRNVEKHAGVDQVTVRIRGDVTHLHVEIVDAGVGFDEVHPAGRGIGESVIGRMQDLGATAAVESQPGVGTTVRLAWSSSDSDDQGGPGDAGQAESVVDGVRVTACWAWAAGVVAVGFGIDPMNRPGVWSSNYLALLIVSALAIGSWLFHRSGGLPAAWIGVLIAVCPVVFWLTYHAVRNDPYRWLALTVTPPMVILLVLARRRAMFWSAVVVHFCSVVIVALASDNSLGIVIMGAVVPYGLLCGWYAFYLVVGRIVERAEVARQAAAQNRAEVAAQMAVRASRERWQQAGLVDAIETLRAIADGSADPQDKELRRQCAEEEQFLRQVMMLSPEAVHLGPQLAGVLAEARSRGVELTVRTGDVDVASVDQANAVGRIVRECIAAARRGDHLTVSTYPSNDRGVRLIVVSTVDLPTETVPSSWRLDRSRWDHQRVIEVSVAS